MFFDVSAFTISQITEALVMWLGKNKSGSMTVHTDSKAWVYRISL